jgi:hypothetical protein
MPPNQALRRGTEKISIAACAGLAGSEELSRVDQNPSDNKLTVTGVMKIDVVDGSCLCHTAEWSQDALR